MKSDSLVVVVINNFEFALHAIMEKRSIDG